MPERELARLLYGTKQEMLTVLKLDFLNKLLNHKPMTLCYCPTFIIFYLNLSVQKM